MSNARDTRLEPVSNSPQIVSQKALYFNADVLVDPLDILRRELGNTHGSRILLAFCEDGHDCSRWQVFLCRREPTALRGETGTHHVSPRE